MEHNISCGGTLDTCLYFSLTKLSRVFHKIGEETFFKTGLSPSHALVLYLVNEHQKLAQKEVGSSLHLTPSTMTRFVEKLERKGYLIKETEGKNVFLVSTKEGMKQQNTIKDSLEELKNTYHDLLSEEETLTLLNLTDKLFLSLTEKGYS